MSKLLPLDAAGILIAYRERGGHAQTAWSIGDCAYTYAEQMGLPNTARELAMLLAIGAASQHNDLRAAINKLNDIALKETRA